MSLSTRPTTVRQRKSERPGALTVPAAACGAHAAARGLRTDPYDAVRLLAMAVGAPAAVVPAGGSFAAAGAFAVLILLLERIAGRRREVLPSALDEMPALALRTLAATAIALAAGLPMSARSSDGPWAVAPLGAMLAALACVALTVATRAAGYSWVRRLRRRGRAGERAVVVGADRVGTRLVALLRKHPEYGLRPVGLVDSTRADGAPVDSTADSIPADSTLVGLARADSIPADPTQDPATVNGSMPVLGGMAELPRLLAQHRIRRVIVAFAHVPDGDLVQILRACDRLDCEIYVVPRLFELATSGSPDTEHLWGVPCIRLPRAPFRAPTWRMKRIIDVTVAAIALLALAPVLLMIAVAVRLEVGPGVLFRQDRVGLDGRTFSLVKFRSLRRATGEESQGWSVVDDDRLGPVGRFLRRTSMDELPQLWNVLVGQMSLVGPRPEQPRYVELFAETHSRYADRLRVPAGVTGLAQVLGLRGNTSIEERVQFDNFYIEHWSLWRDIKIIISTVGSVLFMRGA